MPKTKPKLKLDWATHKAAKYACEHWHYSKCMPCGKLVKIGVWENNKYIGVVIFGRGAAKDLFTQYGLNQITGCELTRVALTKHKTPVSKILSVAIKYLKKFSPRLRLIISYADTSKGHHGGIYQATNWVYVGCANPRKVPILKGKLIHERSLQALVSKGKVKRSDCTWVKAKPKHKYLMPLDDEIKKRIMKLSKSYPKRIEHENNASSYQLEESGAVPTDALQTKSKIDTKQDTE